MNRSDIKPAARSRQNSSLSGHFFTAKQLAWHRENPHLPNPNRIANAEQHPGLFAAYLHPI